MSTMNNALPNSQGDHYGCADEITPESLQGESTAELMADLSLREKEKNLSATYLNERQSVLEKFISWTDQDQVDFVKTLIRNMCHNQHGQIDAYLKPILQRDFIAFLPDRLARYVLSFLDARWLNSSEKVSRTWQRIISHGKLWRRLIERNVQTDPVWKGVVDKRGWRNFLFVSKEKAHTLIFQELGYFPNLIEQFRNTVDSLETQHHFYRNLYPKINQDIESLKSNWQNGRYVLSRITCHSEPSRGVYCLQYDDDKIISGLRDHTIKIWQRKDLQCSKTLRGHTGSVLCLQYDDRVIISGSSDTTVRVWDVHTGELLHTLMHHVEAVLHLRFQNGMMVTCSKDRSIAVWGMISPREINVRRVLVAHRAAVNVVDFDSKYIVSASGDRTIKVWSTDTCEFVRTMIGHRRGIACLQYHDRLVVSGSSDNTIRLWDIEIGACLRVLEGHEQLVRCIRFDSKRIVSGAYDGRIKVWDLQTAMNPRSPPDSICLLTLVVSDIKMKMFVEVREKTGNLLYALQKLVEMRDEHLLQSFKLKKRALFDSEHTGRVFRLQFDEFQIVSSSHDDTILIWDFLEPQPESHSLDGTLQQTTGAAAVPSADNAAQALNIDGVPQIDHQNLEDSENDDDVDDVMRQQQIPMEAVELAVLNERNGEDDSPSENDGGYERRRRDADIRN